MIPPDVDAPVATVTSQKWHRNGGRYRYGIVTNPRLNDDLVRFIAFKPDGRLNRTARTFHRTFLDVIPIRDLPTEEHRAWAIAAGVRDPRPPPRDLVARIPLSKRQIGARLGVSARKVRHWCGKPDPVRSAITAEQYDALRRLAYAFEARGEAA